MIYFNSIAELTFFELKMGHTFEMGEFNKSVKKAGTLN